MKKRVVLLLILFVMTFMLSGCCFWGGCGYCGYPVGFGFAYSSPPPGHGHHPYQDHGYPPPVGTIAAGNDRRGVFDSHLPEEVILNGLLKKAQVQGARNPEE